MAFKPVGINENGDFSPRAKARLDVLRLFDRDRANHTGTQTVASISDFTEALQDAVAAMITAGTGVTVSYDDPAGKLTITSTAVGGTGGATDPEIVRDTIAAALRGQGVITVASNDAADTITISSTATANSSDAQLRDRATHTGTQPAASISDFAEAVAGLTTAAGVTLDGLPGGSAIVIDYYKPVYGAANSWPASHISSRTDLDYTWRGPGDPGSIMRAGDIYEYALGQ